MMCMVLRRSFLYCTQTISTSKIKFVNNSKCYEIRVFSVFTGEVVTGLSTLDQDYLPINDRLMTGYDYDKAKRKLASLEKKYRPKIPANELEDFIYATITVHGHAWCMDVENERRKMTRLVLKALMNV